MCGKSVQKIVKKPKCQTINMYSTGIYAMILFVLLSLGSALSDSRIVSAPFLEGTKCDSTSPPQGDSSVCGNFFLCFNGYYQTQYCASGKYYDTVTKSCINRQTAVTTEGCNRCQYCDKTFANTASPTDCSSYYYCNGGQNGSIQKCKSGYYFDEEKQICTVDATLANYAATNGACSKAGQKATDAPTMGPTEATTKPSTDAEAPSTAPTEAPTKAATEPPTEASTETPEVPDVPETTAEPEDICHFLKNEHHEL